MIKVLSVFGTRPEAIKMAPVIKELERHKELSSYVCVTAQHREMLDQVLRVFDIHPDYDLNIMKRGQSLSDITCAVLQGMKEILDGLQPDLVLVHGDTTTTFAGALAAFYAHIPVGHVEAGLRTRNKYSPYPEEMNRQFTDRVADMMFAPTGLSRDNLLSEGIPGDRIYVTGNTAIDAMARTVVSDYSHPALNWIEPGERLILLTAHRRENLGEPMRNIFRGIRRVIEENPDLKLIYPVHLNPAVRAAADEIFIGCDRIRLIEPLDVLDFHNFMSRAYLILTDSGGVQEEAPSLGKPVLVFRNTTERPEGIEAGTLKLAGTDEENVYSETTRLLNDSEAYLAMSCACNPYGDGHASERIADAIIKKFC